MINLALALPFLLILLYLELIPLMAAGAPAPPTQVFDGMTPPQRGAYFGYLFAQLPGWVNVWMKFQDCIIFASIFFVFWHKPVRWYVGGVIANHIFLFALMPIVPISMLSLGLAAASHLLWIPGLIVFLRLWPSLNKSSAYGTWVTIAILQMCFSLMFDIPQGLAWLASGFN
jgi:hypothetical protein